jgi:bacteriorhodopsin
MYNLDRRANNAVYVNREYQLKGKQNDLLTRWLAPILNGAVADIHITSHGSDWLFAAFSVFGLATLVLLGLTFAKPKNLTFHYLLSIALFVTALDYFAQASDLSFVPIPVEFHRSRSTVAGNARQIWYSRYIDWFITFPLFELALLLAARSNVQQVLFTIALQWIAIVSWLVAALIETRYKWAYFAFGV